MAWFRRALALLSLLTAVLTSNPCFADEPPSVHEARRLFEEGEHLYNLARYEEALKSYQSAYLLAAKPIVLFNVGQCYRKLKKHDEAVHAYKRYLGSADAAVPRADVESLIESEERAAEVERTAVEKPPEGPRPLEPAARSAPSAAVAPLAVPEPTRSTPPASASRGWLWATLGGIGGALALGAIGIGIAYAIPNDANVPGQIEVPFAGGK